MLAIYNSLMRQRARGVWGRSQIVEDIVLEVLVGHVEGVVLVRGELFSFELGK